MSKIEENGRTVVGSKKHRSVLPQLDRNGLLVFGSLEGMKSFIQYVRGSNDSHLQGILGDLNFRNMAGLKGEDGLITLRNFITQKDLGLEESIAAILSEAFFDPDEIPGFLDEYGARDSVGSYSISRDEVRSERVDAPNDESAPVLTMAAAPDKEDGDAAENIKDPVFTMTVAPEIEDDVADEYIAELLQKILPPLSNSKDDDNLAGNIESQIELVTDIRVFAKGLSKDKRSEERLLVINELISKIQTDQSAYYLPALISEIMSVKNYKVDNTNSASRPKNLSFVGNSVSNPNDSSKPKYDVMARGFGLLAIASIALFFTAPLFPILIPVAGVIGTMVLASCFTIGIAGYMATSVASRRQSQQVDDMEFSNHRVVDSAASPLHSGHFGNDVDEKDERLNQDDSASNQFAVKNDSTDILDDSKSPLHAGDFADDGKGGALKENDSSSADIPKPTDQPSSDSNNLSGPQKN